LVLTINPKEARKRIKIKVLLLGKELPLIKTLMWEALGIIIR
jgi:hypothetical protein